jgi:hypothetical protein
VLERELVRKLVRSAGQDRSLEEGVQRGAAAQQFGEFGAAGVCAAHGGAAVVYGSLRAAIREAERGRTHVVRKLWCRMIPCAELGGRSIGRWEKPEITINAWTALEGQPYRQSVKMSHFILKNDHPGHDYDTVTLLAYMTNKDSKIIHPNAYTW